MCPEKEANERELEEYAQAYFKYTKLYQDQADAMPHKPKEMHAAFERVTEPYVSVADIIVPRRADHGPLEIMAEYASRCEDEPRTFDELSVSNTA